MFTLNEEDKFLFVRNAQFNSHENAEMDKWSNFFYKMVDIA